MNSKTKIRLAVVPAAIVTAALTIAVTVLGVKLTNSNKHEKTTFPAPTINKIPGFPFIINPDDHQPQPAYQATEGDWYELGTIEGVNPVNINAFVKQVWGLTINDFK